jgi:hypothetical protein
MKPIRINSKTYVIPKPGQTEKQVRKLFEEHDRNYLNGNDFERHCRRKNKKVSRREAKRSKTLRLMKDFIF